MSALVAQEVGQSERRWSRCEPTWRLIETRAPEMVTTMSRYLIQLGEVLKPRSVEAAEVVLRQFAGRVTEADDSCRSDEIGRTRVLLAQAYRGRGDRDAAERECAAARNCFERLGAAADLRNLVAAAIPESPCGLTAREVEVVRLVATGRSNRDIASELFISEKTVGRHIANIFLKLDVTTRAAATAWVYENGLLQGSMQTAAPENA